MIRAFQISVSINRQCVHVFFLSFFFCFFLSIFFRSGSGNWHPSLFFVISFPYFYCCSLYVCCRDVVVVSVVCHELAIYSKTTSETIFEIPGTRKIFGWLRAFSAASVHQNMFEKRQKHLRNSGYSEDKNLTHWLSEIKELTGIPDCTRRHELTQGKFRSCFDNVQKSS